MGDNSINQAGKPYYPEPLPLIKGVRDVSNPPNLNRSVDIFIISSTNQCHRPNPKNSEKPPINIISKYPPSPGQIKRKDDLDEAKTITKDENLDCQLPQSKEDLQKLLKQIIQKQINQTNSDDMKSYLSKLQEELKTKDPKEVIKKLHEEIKKEEEKLAKSNPPQEFSKKKIDHLKSIFSDYEWGAKPETEKYHSFGILSELTKERLNDSGSSIKVYDEIISKLTGNDEKDQEIIKTILKEKEEKLKEYLKQGKTLEELKELPEYKVASVLDKMLNQTPIRTGFDSLQDRMKYNQSSSNEEKEKILENFLPNLKDLRNDPSKKDELESYRKLVKFIKENIDVQQTNEDFEMSSDPKNLKKTKKSDSFHTDLIAHSIAQTYFNNPELVKETFGRSGKVKVYLTGDIKNGKNSDPSGVQGNNFIVINLKTLSKGLKIGDAARTIIHEFTHLMDRKFGWSLFRDVDGNMPGIKNIKEFNKLRDELFKIYKENNDKGNPIRPDSPSVELSDYAFKNEIEFLAEIISEFNLRPHKFFQEGGDKRALAIKKKLYEILKQSLGTDPINRSKDDERKPSLDERLKK